MKLPGMNDDTPPTDPTQQAGATPNDATATTFSAVIDEGPKKGGSSTAVLIALVVVSGAVLWGMRHLGTRGSINLVDISIDYPVKDESATVDHSSIIRALQESNNIPQVAPQMIAMNPFSWKQTDADVKTVTAAELEAERLKREHEKHMRALEASARNLILNSVMGGRVPVANISGELVAVGDTVADTFTVTRIEGREVEIQAEGRTWVLTVGGE